MRRRQSWAGILWGVTLMLVTASLVGGILTALRPDASIGAPVAPSVGGVPASGDWTQYHYDLSATGDNPFARIDSENVTQLQSRWANNSPKGVFAETPAIIGDTVYAVNNTSLYAYDLRTGQALWHFDDLPDRYGAVLSSAVAVDPVTHIAYYGTPDARVYAVNTVTHQGVWNVRLGDPARGAFIWSSPVLANGKLYIGLASHQDTPCVFGASYALDPATGKTLWRTTMSPSGQLGGGVWSSVAVDPAAGQVIVTTANPCSGTPVGPLEDSILALDWNTGAVVWKYNALHDDSCDCDFGAGAVVYDAAGLRYVVAGSKYGVVYAVTPPHAGQPAHLVWSIRITGAGYYGGAGVYQPAAYADGRLFVAAGPTLDGACPHGALWALDARTGMPLWRVCTAGQVVSAGAISRDVVFAAQQGMLAAYDVATGRELWHAALDGPAWGGVAVAGSTVAVGAVGGHLFCFALPG